MTETSNVSTDEAIEVLRAMLAVMLEKVESQHGTRGSRQVWLELACTAAAAVAQDEGREGLDHLLQNMYEYGGQHLPRY